MDRDNELMDLIDSQYRDMQAGSFVSPESKVCMSLDQVIGSMSHGSPITLMDVIPDERGVKL